MFISVLFVLPCGFAQFSKRSTYDSGSGGQPKSCQPQGGCGTAALCNTLLPQKLLQLIRCKQHHNRQVALLILEQQQELLWVDPWEWQ